MTDKEARQTSRRIDTKFQILLQELRVAQTGVQFLFAFLLSFPFFSRFDDVTEYQKWIYAASLLGTTLSAILFLAPVSQHQFLKGQGMKPAILDLAYTLGKLALFFLLLSMMSAVFLVMDVVFNLWVASIFTLLTTTIAVILWYIKSLQLSNSND
jgi:hypothetical protein